MNRNTSDGEMFLTDSILWAVVGFIWYESLLFVNIQGLAVWQSNLILIGSMILAFVVNCLISGPWSRNFGSVAATTFIPMGVYTFITYKKYLMQFFLPIIIVAGVAAVIGTIFVFCRHIPPSYLRRYSNPKAASIIRRRDFYETVRGIATIACAAMVISIFVKVFIVGSLVNPKVEPAQVYDEEHSMAANMETLISLKEENWEAIKNTQKRLDILQCVANVEGRYLGINKPIQVCGKKLAPNVLGTYTDNMSTVYIDLDHLMEDSVYSSVETICHEMYHAAEYRYVEIYSNLSEEEQRSIFLMDASVYADEFEHYHSGRNDIVEYLEQTCEQDAYRYGRQGAGDYFYKIGEYLEDDTYDDYRNYLAERYSYKKDGTESDAEKAVYSCIEGPDDNEETEVSEDADSGENSEVSGESDSGEKSEVNGESDSSSSEKPKASGVL